MSVGVNEDEAPDLPAAVRDPVRLAAVAATGLLDAEPQAWADELTELAAALLEAPLAFVTLVDESRSFWLSCVGVDPSGARQGRVEESFCQYVIDSGEALVVGDAVRHPRTRSNPAIQSMGVRAWAGYPLFDGDGNVLGSFCVVDVVERDWRPQDVAALGVLAQAAAARLTSLATRRQLEAVVAAEQATAKRLEHLAEVALALVAAETTDDLAEIVLDAGIPTLGADGGAVVIREPDGFRVILRGGAAARGGTATLLLPLDDPLPGPLVARTGSRLILPNRAAGLEQPSPVAEALAAAYEQTDRHAWVIEPLTLGGRTLGSLVVSWTDEQTFAIADLGLIEAFAAQCVQALERIQVTEAQRAATTELYYLADALQRSLLTQPPTPANVDVAVRYVSAANLAQVGGDWHDAFECEDGSTIITIGDVCGHDREAAATMAQIRNLLRGLAIDCQHPPQDVLARLDGAMRRLGLRTMTTAIVGQVSRNGDAFELTWSVGGHPPPILCSPTGEASVLDAPVGLPLAVDPTTERHARTIDLPSGSTIVLYTDGLVERRGEPIDAGIERLRQVIAAKHDDPTADRIADHVLETMVPTPGDDDIALLVLRVR